MRIGFLAGQLDRRGSRVLITPQNAKRDFPGPWELAAVIRITDAADPPLPLDRTDVDLARADDADAEPAREDGADGADEQLNLEGLLP